VSWPRFEPATSQIQVASVAARAELHGILNCRAIDFYDMIWLSCVSLWKKTFRKILFCLLAKNLLAFCVRNYMNYKCLETNSARRCVDVKWEEREMGNFKCYTRNVVIFTADLALLKGGLKEFDSS
jgi:hypothetical protein